jgi:hypothetical protein
MGVVTAFTTDAPTVSAAVEYNLLSSQAQMIILIGSNASSLFFEP